MDLSSYTLEALTRRRPMASSYESIRSAAEGNQAGSNSSDAQQGLRRSLGLVDVIFYGVGCSVGAGIYSLVGIGANLAGPAIVVSFFVCGIACCFTSLAYAEFAARVPLAGSGYVFSYVCFGELCAWLVGWNLTLGYGVSAAVVAQSWALYLVGFVEGFSGWTAAEIDLTYWSKLPIPYFGPDYTCCPLSVVIIALCTAILVTGVKESTRFNTAMTILNLSILLFVLLAGIFSDSVDVSENLIPVFPHGVKGMARGAGLVFFSYLGFDATACLSEECVDPNRNMPRGIIGSLLISMTIYVSVSLVVVGMAPTPLLGPDTPITNALLANACCTSEELQQDTAERMCLSHASCHPILKPFLYVGSRFISFGAIFGLTTATFACLMGQPRINYAAAQDGLLFPIFARVHPRTGVPTVGTIVTGLFTALVACFIDLEVLANAISLGTLQVFSFINAGVIVLRMRGTTALEAPRGTESDSAPHESTSFVPSQDERNPITQSVENLPRALGLVHASSREIWKIVLESERMQNQHSMESSTPTWLVLIFTVACILASLGASNDWHAYIVTGCALLALVSAAALYVHPQSPPPETFTCPFVPTIPLLGILCNSGMMGSLPLSTWWVILTWLGCGLVFYLVYGIHHSELRKVHDPSSRQPAI